MQRYTVTNDSGSPVLLEYSLRASQHPITVSPETGDPVFVTLEFVVSKPKGAADVHLTEIIFTFPFGDASNDLTPEAPTKSNASISTTGQEKWKIDEFVGKGTFKAQSASGKPVTISDQGLTVTFTKLQVNRTVGTVDLKITEKATNNSSAPTNRHLTTHVPKFPYEFFLTGFSATKPSVKLNERATLVWHGSTGPKYLMLFGDGQSENVTGKATWDSHPLTSTTTFMLEVTAESGGESVTHRASATVVVENPNLVATDLTIGDTILRTADAKGAFQLLSYKYGMLWMGEPNLWLAHGGSKTGLTLTSSGALNFGQLTVAPDGRVGIGTAEPRSMFHVNSKDGIRLGLEQNGGGQLVITNNSGDDSIYLEAFSKDGIGKGGKGSAKSLYLGTPGGPDVAALPQLVLHAANTAVHGTLGIAMGVTPPKNALDVKGGVVIGWAYAGTQRAPVDGLNVQGDVRLDAGLNVKQNLNVERDLTVHGSLIPPDNNGVAVAGDLHATGRLTSYHPIDVFFPDKQKWYRMAIGYNDYAWFDNGPFSDLRLKEDVRPIPDALDKVSKLEGKLYRWNEKGLETLTKDVVSRVSAGPGSTEEQHESLRREARQQVVEKLSGDHHGLIAQEVEAIVPEAVSETDDGHKYIRYPQLVALLVEAVKEQAAQIQALSDKVSELGESLRNRTS